MRGRFFALWLGVGAVSSMLLLVGACSSDAFTNAGDAGADAGDAADATSSGEAGDDGGVADAGADARDAFPAVAVPCGTGVCDRAKGEICCTHPAHSIEGVLLAADAFCTTPSQCITPAIRVDCDESADCRADGGTGVCCGSIDTIEADGSILSVQCVPQGGCDVHALDDILCEPAASDVECPPQTTCGPASFPPYAGHDICHF